MRIKYNKGTCAECKEPDKLIVQKSLHICQSCNQKRLTKRYREKRQTKVQSNEKADKTKLTSFYREVWDANPPLCFETGDRLWTFRNWNVHHILHKEDFPELAFNHDICVLLTLEMHSKWHTIAPSDRPKMMPKTYRRYLELCEQYGLEPKF
jgi:hypothetical protein